MSSLYNSLQHIDRRVIYLVLSAVLIVSLLISKPEKPVVLQSVRDLYDAVEKAPAGPDDGKIIVIGTVFGSSTLGECGNQARAIIRHLMLRHKRFAVIAVAEPQGAKLGPMIVQELAPHYGYVYGKDWISFGYQLSTPSFYKLFLNNIPKAVGADGVEGKPITSFPIMRGITSVNKSVAMEIELTAGSSVFDWVQLVQPATKPRLPIGYGCTGVMAAEGYPLLDSGQIVGLAPGLKGAADYEMLVDTLESQLIKRGETKAKTVYQASSSLPGMGKSARRYMYTQSYAHLVVIIFIILGNIGMLLSWRKPRTTPKEEEHNG